MGSFLFIALTDLHSRLVGKGLNAVKVAGNGATRMRAGMKLCFARNILLDGNLLHSVTPRYAGPQAGTLIHINELEREPPRQLCRGGDGQWWLSVIGTHLNLGWYDIQLFRSYRTDLGQGCAVV